MGELVGLDLGIDDVAARMDITERGVSMLDIFSASQELGIPLSPTRLGGLPDLAEVDQYAIAHVNGDHSFAIEKIFDTTARVINHEIGKPEFYSWGELSSMWQGDCLLYTPPAPPTDRPTASFATQHIEIRGRPVGTHVRASFALENSGDTPLAVLRTQTSCNCTAVTPSDSDVLPGESAQFDIEAAIPPGTNPMRYFSAVVYTDDPVYPVRLLTLAVDATFMVRSDPAVLFLERIVQGSDAFETEVFIHSDTDYDYDIVGVTSSTEQVKFLGYSARDSGVAVELSVDIAGSVGVIDESIVISIVDGNLRSLDPLEVAVPIKGEVVGAISALPSRFFFGIVNAGEEGHGVVQLCDHLSDSVTITELSSSSPYISLSTAPSGMKGCMNVHARLDPNTPAGTLEATVTIVTDRSESSALSVPVFALVR